MTVETAISLYYLARRGNMALFTHTTFPPTSFRSIRGSELKAFQAGAKGDLMVEGMFSSIRTCLVVSHTWGSSEEIL